MKPGNRSEFEQPAGPPLVPSVDATAIDAARQLTYRSYESFLRKRLSAIDKARPQQWQRDYTSQSAYSRSVRSMRNRLRKMLGFWVEPRNRRAVVITNPEILLSQPTYEVRRFRFEVLPGLDTYAVELIPKSVASRAAVLLQHGYGVTPELACGLTPSANLGDYSYRSLGIHLAMRGYRVLAVHHPSGYGMPEESCGSIPGHEPLGRTYGKNRLHRMALMAGGTLFGLDMMACSRGVDYLSQSGDVNPDRIGMYGKSQGGQSALYLAAIDQRIRAAVCSAYFNTRTLKLIGPHRATSYLDSAEEDKFFTDVIRTFSDADIVSLIVPRAFAVEAGIKDTSVDFEKAKAEFGRAARHYRQLGIGDQIQFIQHSEGHMAGTKRALSFLDQVLQP